jgi:glycerol-3-phosphate acyltransferase PlsX
MGGDEGLAVMLPASRARADASSYALHPVRRRSADPRGLKRHPTSAHRDRPFPRSSSGEEKPSQAMRRAKTTSMGIAIACVKQGEPAPPCRRAIPAR